jgi:hypothetical protein
VLSALLGISGSVCAADFNRADFLAAFKARLQAEPALAASRPYAAGLRIETYVAKTQGWQKDFATIPSLQLPGVESNATFGLALAYVASRELGLPYSSSRGDALVLLVGVRVGNPSVEVDTRPASFGNILLREVFDPARNCAFQYPVYSGTAAEFEFGTSLCRDMKQVLAEVKGSAPEGAGRPATAPRGRGMGGQYTSGGFVGDSAQATTKLDQLNKEKTQLIGAISEFGPPPEMTATTDTRPSSKKTLYVRSRDGQAEIEQRANANSAEVERQVPVLRAELQKRRIEFARQSAQKGGVQVASAEFGSAPAGSPWARAVADARESAKRLGSVAAAAASEDDALQAYRTAKDLNAACASLDRYIGTRQRAAKAIEAAKGELATPAARSADAVVGLNAKETNQALSKVTAAIQTNDPSSEPELATAATSLTKATGYLRAAGLEVATLDTSIGKSVYQGCSAWAKRKGLATSTPVRVFKNDTTNLAADRAANPGLYLCRCMSTQIARDQEITDDAKLEIGRQFATRDRIDNQALALIVGAAGVKCQASMVEDIARQ